MPTELLFIGGFDPQSPRLHHRRYRRAAAARPNADGVRVEVGPHHALDADTEAWDVHWHDAHGCIHATRHTLLRWDAAVRAHWHRGPAAFARAAWQVWGQGMRGGALARGWPAMPEGTLILALPVLLALALLFGGGAVGAAVGHAWHGAAGAALGAVAAAALALALGWAVERRLDSGWVLRLAAAMAAQARGRTPRLEAALDTHAERLAALLRSGAPDVRVVGHSVGAHLAVSIVARALARAPNPAARLTLVTLGHCTPLLAAQTAASAFRAELAAVAASPQVAWLDVVAAADWAASARQPPWHGLPTGGLRLRRSPRFHAVLTPAHYAALKRDRRALHMQYVNASDLPGGYDWLALSAGPTPPLAPQPSQPSTP